MNQIVDKKVIASNTLVPTIQRFQDASQDILKERFNFFIEGLTSSLNSKKGRCAQCSLAI
jgi:hypothetical protein